jgi:hypothetical protein
MALCLRSSNPGYSIYLTMYGLHAVLVYEYLLMSWVLRPCMYILTYPLKQLVLTVFMFNQCAALRICLCIYINHIGSYLLKGGGGF